MSKKTLKDEDNIPSIFSQASAEEIATNIAIKKEALDLAIKEGDRLEKELGISKFLDDFAKDICDEGQEVFTDTLAQQVNTGYALPLGSAIVCTAGTVMLVSIEEENPVQVTLF